MLLGFVLLAAGLSASEFDLLVEKGNVAYEAEDHEEALHIYHDAQIEEPDSPLLNYNIGNALYRQEKYEPIFLRIITALRGGWGRGILIGSA